MKLKLLLSGIGILLAHLSSGQVTKEQFGKAVDYLSCRLSLLSLEKNIGFEARAKKFRGLCPCGEANSTQVVNTLNALTSVGTLKMAQELATVPSNEAQRFLNNSSAEEVVAYLTEGIFEQTFVKSGQRISKYSSVANFETKLAVEEINELRANIREILSAQSPINQEDSTQEIPPVVGRGTRTQDNEANQAATLKSKLVPLNVPAPKTNSWLSWQFPALSTLLGLLAGAGLTFLYFRGKEKEARSSKNKSAFDDFNQMHGQTSFDQAKTDRRRIEQLEIEVITKNAENARLKAALNPIIATESKPEPTNVAPPTGEGGERFFSIPDLDERQRGFWYDENGSGVYRPHASTYRLLLSSDQQSARFEVADAPETVSKLIRSRVSGVLPVCTELNAYSPEARRITTKTPGKARREGNRWVVTEPAQIEYA